MKKIDIICGISSLGLPFPAENKEHVGFFDLVLKHFKDSGFEVEGLNISRLDDNCTWHLKKDFKKNHSYATIKNLQIHSIKKIHDINIFFRLIVPNSYKKNLQPTLEDENINVTDFLVKSKSLLFLYNAGVNDFFTYINGGAIDAISSSYRQNLPSNLPKYIKKSIDNIEKNWIYLHDLNPDINIMAISAFFPNVFKIFQSLIWVQEKFKGNKMATTNKFKILLKIYNKYLEEAAFKYDYVHYVDINHVGQHCAFMDFHPNTYGNELIADSIIDAYYKSVNKKNTNDFR